MKNGGARQRAKKRLRLNPLLEQVRTGARPRRRNRSRKSNDRSRDRPPPSAMRCADVARDLQRRDLLPAIFFVFSRRGCEEEAKRVGSSLQLLTREEEGRRAIIQNLGAGQRGRRDVDSENERVQLLTRGVAATTPASCRSTRLLVEDLFKRAW